MFIKPYKKLNKRGFTLIELTIVMAISAIISVMIISFTTLISAQVKKNNLRADFMQNAVDFRTDLQIEFAEVDGTILTDEEGNPLPYHFTVEETTIKIEKTSFEFSWNGYEYIDSVKLSTSENDEILKVVLTNSNLGEEQSFVIISKTGRAFTTAS